MDCATVGLAVHPDTGELWATNNGRDMLGDELPPEALYIVRDGLDYGWPRCHNGTIKDPDFGGLGACRDVVMPVVNMQAHSVPLGLVFYTGKTSLQNIVETCLSPFTVHGTAVSRPATRWCICLCKAAGREGRCRTLRRAG